MPDQRDKKRGLPERVKMRHDTHFIDELTTRHEEPVGLMLAVEAIETDPNQPRSSVGDLDDLVRSIGEKGILEPILLRPLGEREGAPRYRIISGERRFRAAREAGVVEVPAIVLDVDEDEALEIQLIENLQRKDLTPFEEAEGYRALADRHGYTHQEIGAAVGRSRSLVSETLKLLEMPEAARRAADEAELTSRSLLLEILKASGGDEAAMLEMIAQAALGQLSRDDVRQEVREQRPRSAARRKPYVFKFRAPDKTFNLSLSFRRSEVDRGDLIGALETILDELKSAEAGEIASAPVETSGETEEE